MYFDDDYNYMQHLKPRGMPGAEFVPADDRFLRKVLEEKERTVRVGGLSMPASAFATTYEEDVGLLNRAAPQSGPRLDLDPDLVGEGEVGRGET